MFDPPAPDLLPRRQAMAGLRNILIHGYQQIGNDSVRDVVKDHLPDILRFAPVLWSAGEPDFSFSSTDKQATKGA